MARSWVAHVDNHLHRAAAGTGAGTLITAPEFGGYHAGLQAVNNSGSGASLLTRTLRVPKGERHGT
jgi:hypothetical protein